MELGSQIPPRAFLPRCQISQTLDQTQDNRPLRSRLFRPQKATPKPSAQNPGWRTKSPSAALAMTELLGCQQRCRKEFGPQVLSPPLIVAAKYDFNTELRMYLTFGKAPSWCYCGRMSSSGLMVSSMVGEAGFRKNMHHYSMFDQAGSWLRAT